MEYYIGTDIESLSKSLTDDNAIAKLRGDLTNTEYILYDVHNRPSNERAQTQMAAIIYVSNETGTNKISTHRLLKEFLVTFLKTVCEGFLRH